MTALSDGRITESSSLATSLLVPDLLYTCNDENGPLFAVRASTGRTASTFKINHRLTDPESLGVDSHGNLWIADCGDNQSSRHNCALYSLHEPGTTGGTHSATKYPIQFPDGPRNCETLLINPNTGHKCIVTKAAHGELYAVPWTLKADQPNMLVKLRPSMPAYVTDGCFTLSGRFVLLRRKGQQNVVVMDSSWRYVTTIPTPRVRQPESITMHPSGDSFYIGSEGSNSPLIRLPLEEGCR